MRQKSINEVQFRNVITNMVMEELNRQQLDEGFWKRLKAAASAGTAGMGPSLKNGAINTATNFGNAVKGAYNTAVDKVSGAYNTAVDKVSGAYNTAANKVSGAYNTAVDKVAGAYNTAADKVSNAYNSAATNVGNRVKAAKVSYNAQRNMDKINKLLNLINELEQDGILHGKSMTQAIKIIKKQLNGAIGRERGTITNYRNDFMPR